MSDSIGPVFAALADPTRRSIVDTILAEGSTSVPVLESQLPISRQAVAKHLLKLDRAGVVERTPGEGREVRYQLRPNALVPAAAWLNQAEAAWEHRLRRLKQSVERS